ncbi:MAG: type II toxin-antitoxin system HipA family toxin [Firmicutes bacterium]|nr:type II toxin-antitoxin system HipA family toxin [Bacillota bacterium]
MIKVAKVKLWGTIIGYFTLDESKGFVSFEYEMNFLNSGIEVSPIKMPLSRKIYEFPELLNTSFKGVPGLISDSLPDKFGNAIIDRWLASQGRTSESFNVLERLCYTGKRGMGALEYEPDSSGNKDSDEEVSIAKMVDFASAILDKQKSLSLTSGDDISYQQLLKLGTSAGGARAKAIIAYNKKTREFRSGQIDLGEDFEHWLIKFDGVRKNGDYNHEDEPEYTLIEYSYYLMAKKAGITMSECRLFTEGNNNHFMTKRFDRDKGEKVHMQSLGAILHLDYNTPALCSYERAALTAKQIGCPSNDIEQFFKRMVFNVLAVNQDDHVKNISFLMDRKGNWYLSPAYDVTFAYDLSNQWLKSHQMSINGKTTKFNKEDLMQCGKSMDIKTSKCSKIIDEVYNIVKEYEILARSVNIKESTIKLLTNIQKTHHSYFFE